jgi:hypothetical protein
VFLEDVAEVGRASLVRRQAMASGVRWRLDDPFFAHWLMRVQARTPTSDVAYSSHCNTITKFVSLCLALGFEAAGVNIRGIT